MENLGINDYIPVQTKCDKCGGTTGLKLEDGRGGYLIRCESCNEYIEIHLAPEIEMMKKMNANRIHCPFCNSSDCKKISDLSKVASAAVFGVFSLGKVSKTWHCNSCGSNFG